MTYKSPRKINGNFYPLRVAEKEQGRNTSRFSWMHLLCHPWCYKVAVTTQQHFFKWRCPEPKPEAKQTAVKELSPHPARIREEYPWDAQTGLPLCLSDGWTTYAPLLGWALVKREGWAPLSPGSDILLPVRQGFVSREETGMAVRYRQPMIAATMIRKYCLS